MDQKFFSVDEGKKIYTVDEVAEMLRLDSSTIRRFLRKKELRGLKFGLAWRIEEKDLNEFIESRWNRPALKQQKK